MDQPSAVDNHLMEKFNIAELKGSAPLSQK
jgi:hypothetical protein